MLKNKKKIGALAAGAVLMAAVIAFYIYNSPPNQLQRNLDLGNKYLAELNYEEAIATFHKVIEIDKRCMEAYVGGIFAYQQIGDAAELRVFYEKALAAIAEADEATLTAEMEHIVDIYRAASDVYGDDLGKAVEVLEQGYEVTRQNEEIKDMLVITSRSLAEHYEDTEAYEEALEVYNQLITAFGLKEDQTARVSCLQKYIEVLKAEENWEKLRELIEEYRNIVTEIDFDALLTWVEGASLDGEDYYEIASKVLFDGRPLIEWTYEELVAVAEEGRPSDSGDLSQYVGEVANYEPDDDGWYGDVLLVDQNVGIYYGYAIDGKYWLNIDASYFWDELGFDSTSNEITNRLDSYLGESASGLLHDIVPGLAEFMYMDEYLIDFGNLNSAYFTNPVGGDSLAPDYYVMISIGGERSYTGDDTAHKWGSAHTIEIGYNTDGVIKAIRFWNW